MYITVSKTIVRNYKSNYPLDKYLCHLEGYDGSLIYVQLPQ